MIVNEDRYQGQSFRRDAPRTERPREFERDRPRYDRPPERRREEYGRGYDYYPPAPAYDRGYPPVPFYPPHPAPGYGYGSYYEAPRDYDSRDRNARDGRDRAPRSYERR
jgi:hypothetical protein